MTSNTRDVFISAVKLPPEQRATFLTEACAGDGELRERVESLLAAHDEVSSILSSPSVGDVTIDLPMRAGPGAVIGPYKLLEQIGEGGFGIVYRAEQEQPIRRQVALKVLKPGMDTKQVVARFEVERQALALMDHPNIARVLDGGATPAGLPYFVMELVKGVPITQYCDGHRLTLRQRLELFVSVCKAVQHAHQKGIIHRDLKPSNVLVTVQDSTPVVKVIDFGVAKAMEQQLTDKTLFTGFAQMIGTPLYMSPEQTGASGLDVDTRSDIYSLGVLLYELLTGTTPVARERFKNAAYEEIRRIIREEEPPRPSARLAAEESLPALAAKRRTEPARLTRLVSGELDWIAMKALEKDRNRRYETANGLALDVERYLRDEPVLASPPTMRYRLRKFLRRNSGLVAAVSLVMIALVGGIIGTTWGMFEANAAWQGEKDARKEAQDQAAIATAVSDFLQKDLLFQADVAKQPGKEKGKPKGKGPDKGRDPGVSVRTLLDRASRRIEGRFADAPLVEAAIRMTIGQTYIALAEYDEPRPHLERAIALRTVHLGPDHQDTLESKLFLGVLYVHLGRGDEAEPLYEEVVRKYTARLGPLNSDTLIAKHHLAKLYMNRGKLGVAEKLLVEAIAALPTSVPALHNCKRDLAGLYFRQARLDEAEKLYEELLRTATAQQREDHPETLSAQTDLARLYGRRGEFERALALLDQVLKTTLGLRDPDHPNIIDIKQEQAAVYLAQERPDRAEALLKETLQACRDKLGLEHGKTTSVVELLAKAYLQQEEFDAAEALLREVIDAEFARREPGHPGVLKCQHMLGKHYLLLDDVARAEPLLLSALNGVLKRYGPDFAGTLKNKESVALLYRRQGKLHDAERLLRECQESLGRMPSDPWQPFFTKALLGECLLDQKRFAESEPLLLEGFEGLRSHSKYAPPPVRRQLGRTGEALVQLYEAWDKPDEARSWRTKTPQDGKKKKKGFK